MAAGARRALGRGEGRTQLLPSRSSRYDCEDAEVARRLADRISLMSRTTGSPRRRGWPRRPRSGPQRLEATVETLTRELENQRAAAGSSGSRSSWKETLNAVGRVAKMETTVLITGESGTGKEVVAKLLHQGSPRGRQAVRRHQLRGAARAAPRIRAVRLTRRARSPERLPPRSAGSSRRRAGRCSSTRSPR